jgi:O-antigen ligase
VSFWGWLAKDFLLDLFLPPMAEGKLLTTIGALMVPLFIAGRLPGRNRARSIPQPRTRSIVLLFLFFFYCTMSGFLSGNDAFTRFKLLNLLISIVLAYLLAGKTIRAITINKMHFFAVGLLLGAAGRFFLFNDVSRYNPVLGLREMATAHLNVQDFYVLLFLGATALLFSGPLRPVRLLMWAGASALSLPMAIAMNSRMLPFTLGVTLVYMAVALRSVMLRRTNIIRNLVLLIAVALAGAILAKESVNTQSRMMGTFELGAEESFAEDPRAISFAEAVDNFLGSPIEGIGFGKFLFPGGVTDSTDKLSGYWPHNLFLELLSELGLIGFVLFLIPFGPMLKKILLAKFGSDNESVVFPALAFVYVVATMQLTQNIYYPVFWLSYLCCDAALQRADWNVEERSGLGTV